VAEPASDISGGLFKKLSPKNKRIAAAIGIAMVLALIVLLGRRNQQEPASTDPQATDSTGDLGEPVPLGDPPFQPQSTFADNGAAAGVLSTAITQGLGEVGSSLDAESQAFTDLADQLGTPAAAPGPLGAVGSNKGQQAALAKQKQKIAAQKRRIGQLQKHGGSKPRRTKPAPGKPAGPKPAAPGAYGKPKRHRK
jgi:hypothetical protein